MEKKSKIHELVKLEPTEWTNIPKPVASAFSLVKHIIKEQEDKIEDMEKRLKYAEQRNEKQVSSLQNAINNGNDMIINVEENSKQLIAETEKILKTC